MKAVLPPAIDVRQESRASFFIMPSYLGRALSSFDVKTPGLMPLLSRVPDITKNYRNIAAASHSRAAAVDADQYEDRGAAPR
jgi:hypothetical protein